MRTIVEPSFAAIAREGAPYRGVLFVGLMLTAEGPKVIEYNARFGDPECQVLLTAMQDDLLPLVDAAARGAPLPDVAPPPRAAACVVMVSGGYPERSATGVPIDGIDEAERAPGVVVFHAGTATRDGRLVTAGGRVLGVTATAASVPAAVERAYAATARIRFDGMHFRRDIGRRKAAPKTSYPQGAHQ
jgi:phosphoribosylamine--glycine ligase